MHPEIEPPVSTAQPHRARELSTSHASFSTLFAASVDGCCGLDAAGYCTFLNAAGAAMLGLTSETLVGQLLHETLQPRRGDLSVYPASQSRISKAASEGISVRVDDGVFCRSDGSPMAVSYVLLPLANDGKPAGAVITFSDITARSHERARHELLDREMRAADERLADVFKHAPAFMCILRGPEHVFDRINDRYLQIVGNQRELIGLPVRQALPEVEGQGFYELLDRVYTTGKPFTGLDMPVFLHRVAGEPAEKLFIDLSYTAFRGENGLISGVFVHGVDQTDRKMAEQAERDTQERYGSLVASMDEGFCVVELIFDLHANPVDYRFIEANAAFELHSGLQNVIGHTIRELVPDFEQRWIDIYAQVIRTGKPERLVDTSVPLSRWFDVYAMRVGGPDIRRVAILFKDITDRKRSEEHLREFAADLSEADRRKSEFLATLAHELRNPLAPIRSGLGVLRLSQENPTVTAKTIEMMDRQVNNMVNLIDDLLDVARINGGKVELKKVRMDLKSVLATAIETSLPLIEVGLHELVVDIPDAPMMLDADPTRIAQIFANLLNNAAKYTLPGGKIILSARQEGDSAVVSVTDNGVGISRESLTTIFDMFSQVGRNMGRAQGGLGIGLSLVRELVDRHEGSVVATSDGIDRGASFTVRLPLDQAIKAEVSGSVSAPLLATTGAALRIMVVDDNIDAADTLASVLSIKGHDIKTAYDGLQALELAKDFQPEVAFLDIGMPGMNGYETAQALRKLPALENMLLVALTGWGASSDRARSKDSGFDHHMTKPADLSRVDALLSKLAAHNNQG